MIKRNLVSWNAMLGAYAQNGLVDDSKLLFDGMPAWDMVSLNTLLSGYAENGPLTDAKDFFFRMIQKDRMEMAGMEPNETTFLCIVLGCNYAGSVLVARDLVWSLRRDFGMKPSKVIYGCLADVFARSGDVNNAQELVKSMPFVNDVINWQSLLSFSQMSPKGAPLMAKLALESDPNHPAPYVMLANIVSH
ncbi:hypothetical protein SELMODRAFT_123361 [Selaginella moellendorffii]|uniref:Pentacotripeptide-repeat region of PRORP domain-containing protein n=1 Tax=Selaginella moellendorffii TaxID=88036 RepID=D8SRM0_SELML|nr:hypothetical protein SELMODRAFT_123361 [Selaginella moellendorffii]